MDETTYYPNAEIISWNFDEYDPEPRSNAWYVWFGIVLAGFLVQALVTANFLFAIILLLFAITLFLQKWRKPAKLHFGIAPSGVTIADQFHRMSELKEFWIAYNPPKVKVLYLQFESSFKPLIGIPLDVMDPLQVREILLEFLPENLDKEDEPFPDALSRIMRL